MKNHPSGKKRRPTHKKVEPAYTEAQPVNITRFLVRIATVAAIVLALVFGMSIFFNVEKVEIAGAEKYSLQQIEDAAGIHNGENLLTLNKTRIASRLLTKLPYIKSVRVAIRLPDTIVIEVVESQVGYAIADREENWYLVSAEGKVLEKVSASAANSNTCITGVLLENPQVGEDAVAAEIPPVDENGNPLPVTVYNRERLAAALTIATELEKNGVLGQVTQMDMADMGNLTMQYAQRYAVRLGDSNQLPKKIYSVVQAIRQMSEYQTGILDASFTTWPDKVWYGKGE